MTLSLFVVLIKRLLWLMNLFLSLLLLDKLKFLIRLLLFIRLSLQLLLLILLSLRLSRLLRFLFKRLSLSNLLVTREAFVFLIRIVRLLVGSLLELVRLISLRGVWIGIKVCWLGIVMSYQVA